MSTDQNSNTNSNTRKLVTDVLGKKPVPAESADAATKVEEARSVVRSAFAILSDEELEAKMDAGRKMKAAQFTADAKGTVDKYLRGRGASEVSRLVRGDLDQSFAAYTAEKLRKRGE